jgi:hypothetical protein
MGFYQKQYVCCGNKPLIANSSSMWLLHFIHKGESSREIAIWSFERDSKAYDIRIECKRDSPVMRNQQMISQVGLKIRKNVKEYLGIVEWKWLDQIKERICGPRLQALYIFCSVSKVQKTFEKANSWVSQNLWRLYFFLNSRIIRICT